MKKISIAMASFVSLFALQGCMTTAQQTDTFVSPQFKDTFSNVLPIEKRYRRKWDGPVITDLDQDGLLDIITTEHGSATNVYWNLGGVFSKPHTLFKLDTHGVAVADLDHDGKVEIIVMQGGGNGANPKFPLMFEVSKDRTIERLASLDHFEFTRGRSGSFIDADQNGSLELITTGLPLKTQPDGANHLYKLDENGIYQFVNLLPQAKWLGYRMQTIDIDGNGDRDVLFYGGENIVAITGQAGLSFENTTQRVLGELANTNHVSSIAEIDFDNDGDEDLFLTRAEHQFKRQQFYDAQNKRLAFFTFKKQKQTYDLEIDGDFIVKNLQMAYPDFAVWVGESKRLVELPKDKHGHHDFTFTKKEAQGWPEDRSEKGIYIGYLGDNKWRLAIDSRARNAGVIMNVMNHFDTTELMPLPAKLFENVNGTYIDSTAKIIGSPTEQTTSSAIADYNNDGWPDIFVVRYGNMATTNKQILFLNEQGRGFKRVEDHGIISTELGATGNGATSLDYDKDGDIDILYANERGLWHLFENKVAQSHDQNFVGVVVGNSPVSQINALDAVITVEACGLKQRTNIGNGSGSFSQGTNGQIHFGLGQCKSVDKITVTWRNGEQKILTDIKTNQYNELN